MGRMSRVEKWFVNRGNRYVYRHVVKGQLQKHLFLREGSVFLELGCGTGHAAVLINEVYRPEMFSVTDYDISQVSMAEGERWARCVSWLIPLLLVGFIVLNLSAG